MTSPVAVCLKLWGAEEGDAGSRGKVAEDRDEELQSGSKWTPDGVVDGLGRGHAEVG